MTYNLLNRLAAYAANFTKICGVTSLAVTTGSALTLSTSLIAAEIPLLNHNFDSDAITDTSNAHYSISGWVSTGSGTIGFWAPAGNGTYYDEIGNRGQVGFLSNGGRISQTTNANLIQNETYTVAFDIGYPKTESEPNFVVRIKANGLVVAQEQSSHFQMQPGHWSRESLTFTATEGMPIGAPIVVEFSKLSSEKSEADIDNITLSTSGTGTASPGTQLGPLTMIVEDTTLLVPNQYPNINAALRYLDDKQIKVGKTVTIQVTDCTNQVYNESINVAHPNGNAIHIIGNVDSPESCVLQFNGVSGFVAENGSHIGLIEGFDITGNSTHATFGIRALNNSYAKVGENTIVSYFFSGMYAGHGSTIIASGTYSHHNQDKGYEAFTASSIDVSYATASYNSIGFRAGYNGSLMAYRSRAIGNKFGYHGIHTGFIYAAEVTNSGNTSNFYEINRSLILR